MKTARAERSRIMSKIATMSIGIALTVVLAVVSPLAAMETEDDSHPTTQNSPSPTGSTTPTPDPRGLVSRQECSAPPPNVFRCGRMSTYPPEMVVIDQTGGSSCDRKEVCCRRIAKLADRAFNHIGLNDLGYHFYIGHDGTVYEGRKSDLYGAHTPGYNCKSYGIALIGNYNKNEPQDAQVQAIRALMAKLVDNKQLSPDFKVYGRNSILRGGSRGETTLDNLVKTYWPRKDSSLPERCLDSKIPVVFRRIANSYGINDHQWEIINDCRRWI